MTDAFIVFKLIKILKQFKISSLKESYQLVRSLITDKLIYIKLDFL